MKNLVTANQSHIEDAFEKINKVARFLKRNDFNEFAVVGSSALLVCGFPLNRNVGDIDVEVICSHKREQVFKALADAYGNNFYEAREEYPEVAGSTHKPYIFEIAGVKVNVWCVKEFTHSMLVEARGIRFSTLMSTLCRKMAYKRKKDSRDALSFASTLIEMSK
jgi:hypothetical protein